eukprot:gene13054-biopygen15548
MSKPALWVSVIAPALPPLHRQPPRRGKFLVLVTTCAHFCSRALRGVGERCNCVAVLHARASARALARTLRARK